jgi:putative peptide zinc metalloprotease protein
VLSPHDWLWIAAWGLGLKVVHELSHGLACVRFGGRVRDAGVVFLLFAPIPYVDLTSTWRLSKWHRIVISLAGMLAELSLAAVAAIVWANTTDELLRQHLLQLMLTASVVTFLFNANPLMRFDGYYVLADALELPNLAMHGQQLSTHAAKRWLLGVSLTQPTWPEGRTWLIGLYGIASAVWRTVVSVSLVAAVIAWFVQTMWKSLRYVAVGSSFEQPSRTRFALLAITAVAGVMLLLDSAPAWNSVKLPGVVEYVDAAIVRAEASGFVAEVCVQSGQTVATGDLLTCRSRTL